MEKILIPGGKYTLKIQAKVTHHTWTGGNSETGDRACSSTYWSGQAVLRQPDYELIFNFATKQHHDVDSIGSLEDEFIIISGISKNASIANKEKIVELFCEKLWDHVRKEERKNELFVVTVTPPILDGLPLINEGLIIEPGYQMSILP